MLIRANPTAENFPVTRPASPVSGEVLREPARSVLNVREHRKRSKTQPEAGIDGRRLSKDFGSSAKRLVFGLLLAVAAPAVAAETSTPSKATAANSLRRDPAGRTGISPSWEAIKRGDEAYVAHNIDGAIHEYQAAIEAHPQNPVGHYRLACVLIAKNEYKQAQESLDAALRFSKSDPNTAGKTLFIMADLKERQQDYPAALTAWKAYSIFAATHKEAKTFPSSAESRLSRLAAYVKLAEQSEQVKQRIAERLQNSEFKGPQGAKGSKKEDSNQ